MNLFGSVWQAIFLIFMVVGGVALIWGFLYWLLVITEGVYLGSWAVIWGYDIVAKRYDNIKEFTAEDEQILVVDPIIGEIGDLDGPLLLDVATGTGRVPYFLCQDGRFLAQNGRVIALEPSKKMLNLAQEKLMGQNYPVDWVRQFAVPLPFPANTFDMVTCLEAVEFFPDQETALVEMCRVLKRGGTLMVTRRTGWESHMFFGRAYTREQFEAYLLSIGFAYAMTFPWETIYDIVIVHK